MNTQNNIAEVSLVYKSKVKASERPKIRTCKDAFELFYNSWDQGTIEHVEEFKLLLLNRSNAVLGMMNVSKGGISGTVTDVRILMQAAIKANASALIVAHNHPSGNMNPSGLDTNITSKIKDAGKLLDIQLLDHLIITADGEYYSFADNGLI